MLYSVWRHNIHELVENRQAGLANCPHTVDYTDRLSDKALQDG